MKPIDVYWAAIGTAGLEHLIFMEGEAGAEADGLVLRYHNGTALRIAYRVECDPQWKTRKVALELTGRATTGLQFFGDGNGGWSGENGAALGELAGCLDVDIMATPFTNTLPVRRLGLAVGESREIAVAYVSIPDLRLSRLPQRYTCLEKGAGGGRYLYESLQGGFKAELRLDEHGLVVDYEGIWERLL